LNLGGDEATVTTRCSPSGTR